MRVEEARGASHVATYQPQLFGYEHTVQDRRFKLFFLARFPSSLGDRFCLYIQSNILSSQ